MTIAQSNEDREEPWVMAHSGAWKTLQGIETMHMINKGRVRWLAKGDAVGQVNFVHKLFGVAA